MAILQAARDGLRRAEVKKGLRIVGLALLLAGAALSASTLDLAWSDLSPGYLFLNFLVLTPALLGVAAVTFRITVRVSGREITLVKALRTVAAANVAELLPLPGGAFVRGVALVETGAGVGEATRLVLLTAFLTLGLSCAISAAALGILASPAWYWLAGVMLVGVSAVLFLLSRQADVRQLSAMVAIRLLSLTLTLARLVIAFATLGATTGWLEAAIYAAAPTLGAAVGVIPAGLGVNESIAAVLATLIASSPATAFLAVALNRCLGLLVGASLAIISAKLER